MAEVHMARGPSRQTETGTGTGRQATHRQAGRQTGR